MTDSQKVLALALALMCVALGAWVGAVLRTQDVYTACSEQGWYPVRQAHEGKGGTAVLCSVVTSEQIQQALEEE